MNKNPNVYILKASAIFGFLCFFTLVKYLMAKDSFEMNNYMITMWIAGIVTIIGFVYYYFRINDKQQQQRE